MLIIDGPGSQVLNGFIEYCTQNQIVAFCLPPHTTRIFQPLDVKIFGPFANTYKLLIEKKR